MSNKKLSGLSTTTSTSNLWLSGYDSTRTAGDQNVTISGASLVAALQAGASQGSQTVTQTPSGGISVAANGYTDYKIFTPAASNTDVLIFALELKGVSIAAPVYDIQIFAGPPTAGNPVQLWRYSQQYNNTFMGADGYGDFRLNNILYVPLSYGSNEIWLRLTNQQNTPMVVLAQIVCMEYVGNGPLLAGYVPPAPYTGALMNTVHVGASEQFIEPMFALAALADGGTMYIDGGIYYYPFGVCFNPTKAGIQKYGYNPSDPYHGPRFQQGITIIGNGTYGTNPTVFDGRGGYGLQPTHPFALTAGQGFVWTETNLNISDCQFYYCGGDDNDSDGEAGLYIKGSATVGGVLQTSTVNVTRCAFDKNENGIFAQAWYSSATDGEIDERNATGPCSKTTLNITDCDFSYAMTNGGGGDGGSHDMYIECMWLNISNCNFYGDVYPLPWRKISTGASTLTGQPIGASTQSGNLVKYRGCHMTITNSWFRCMSGKWIDMPQGGLGTISNCTFLQAPGANTLCLAYNTEGQNPTQIMGDMVFTNCTFYVSRNATVFWNMTPSHIFDMTSGNTVHWVNSNAFVLAERSQSGYAGAIGVLTGWDAYFKASISGASNVYQGTATFSPNPSAPHPVSFTGNPAPYALYLT